MRILLLAALLLGAVNAATLPQLIESARTKQPTLQEIKLRIAAADYAISRAKNFDNPMLGIGVNDIRLDRPADRSLERMQTQYVTFSQKIPWFGKRDARRALSEAAKSYVFASLKEAEAVLFAKIRQSAYRLWEIERLIGVTRRTVALTEQNIELFEAYTASGESGNTHMGIISAELVKSRLKTSLQRLEAERRAALALLGYLSFAEVKSLKIELEERELPPLERLLSKSESSPAVRLQKAKRKIEQSRLEIYRLKGKIDPVVRLGYYQRSSFEDYLSIGVGLSLPVYGTEKSLEEEQRVALAAQKLMVIDSKRRVAARLEKLYARAKSSREILHIIEKESIPQIDHMFDLIRSEIAAGGDLYKFVDLVEQKLKLDAEAISARAKYYMTLAEIEAILGEKI
ncbi:heavy metal RND efflux outer membrane protein, CzcC family [Hydrogenimonas sp.]|nr:heavy metal RND efflux outer membrane protein, CzcC family [Hydrogenimonas sp.]